MTEYAKGVMKDASVKLEPVLLRCYCDVCGEEMNLENTPGITPTSIQGTPHLLYCKNSHIKQVDENYPRVVYEEVGQKDGKEESEWVTLASSSDPLISLVIKDIKAKDIKSYLVQIRDSANYTVKIRLKNSKEHVGMEVRALDIRKFQEIVNKALVITTNEGNKDEKR